MRAGGLVAVAVGLAFPALAQAGITFIGPGDKEIEATQVKGKVRTDGSLTVGQTETIVVKNFPKGMKFQVALEPSPYVPVCQSFTQECLPQPVYPIAGSPPFRTKGKGRAVVSFVVPSAYELFDYVDPTRSHPIEWVNGQAARIEVVGEQFRHRRGKFAFIFARALGRAAIQVPSSG